MDNIIIEKIWEDTDFYKVKIEFISNSIQCKLTTYIVNDEINSLSNSLIQHANNNVKFNWEIGECGSESCPKITICSQSINKNGHVTLNIYCDTFDFSSRFSVRTELGLLETFGKEILQFNNPGNQTLVSLNERQGTVLCLRESNS